MEILNITTARSVWIFNIDEINPKGKYTPDIFNWIKERYQFEKTPSSAVDIEDKALVFSRGRFVSKEGFPIRVELKVYNDGILAETISSTHDSDAFIGDLLNSTIEKYGFVLKPEMIKSKLYMSELYFKSEKRLSSINDKLSEFANKITNLIPGNSNVKYDVGGIHFWAGPTKLKIEPPKFVIERKLNELPEENKFFSSAPLHTDDHIDLLKELEDILVR